MESAPFYGGWQPGQGPAVRVEVLHESARARVTRLFLPHRAVVRKEPLGRDAQVRLEHELGMLERLHGVVGVAQLVQPTATPTTRWHCSWRT